MVAGGMENGRASNAARVSDVPTFARHPGVFWNFDNVWQKQRRSAEQGLKRRLECNRMRRKYCTLYALKLFDNGQTNFYHSYGLQSLATYDL